MNYTVNVIDFLLRAANYIDVHIYAGADPKGDMAGAAIPRTKPILMGETGTYKPWFKNISIAAHKQ